MNGGLRANANFLSTLSMKESERESKRDREEERERKDERYKETPL